jgi:Raf kinase inhibitor-like YbhB/YbcL family protein
MTPNARWFPLALLVSALPFCACGATQSGPGPSGVPGKSLASITVTSKSFPSDLQIPVDLSCDGKDTSPQLTWSSPPEGTKSLVLIVDDPDAPGSTFTHWVVFDLPPETLMLEPGVDPATLGAKVGLNDFRNVRYNGPCPPRGEMHRYQFRVFAADYVLPLKEGVPRADVDAALSEHVLGFGTLLATFSH